VQTSFLAGLATGTASVFLLMIGASLGFAPVAETGPETPMAQIAQPPETAPQPDGFTRLDLQEEQVAPPMLATIPPPEAPPESPLEGMAPQASAPQVQVTAQTPPPPPVPDLAQPAPPAPDNAPPLPDSQSATLPAIAGLNTPGAPSDDNSLAAPAPPEALPPAQEEQVARPEPSAMPGTPVPGRVPAATESNASPDAAATALPALPGGGLTALERNSQYDGTSDGAPKMALILYDPGLPMALRHAVAAFDFPITLALNPLDPSAAEAAEMYFNAGKEVIILAAGLPTGASPADMDVTLGSYLDSFPTAIGLVDLPTDGFARNAGLLRDVLAILQRDGHGLITFAGGLSQAARAAEAADLRHAEIFRVIDPGPESQFTIRRFLDRAVFQASQMGHVIVYGDAANDATMEALELWRNEGRADQVALVPVSAILLEQR
jgi:uncharacterized protein